MPINPARFKINSAVLAIAFCLGLLAVSLLLSLVVATMLERGGLAKDYSYAREDASSLARHP